MKANDPPLQNVHARERAIALDDEIVSAAQAGSPGAFAELHAIYSRRLYKTIFAITKCPEDAEDALQETFLRAHVALHTFEGRSNVYSWLTRIAINSALMTLRRRRARPEILFDPQPDSGAETVWFEVKDSSPNPEESYERRQRHLTLMRAIRRLEPQLRTPIWMQTMHGCSMREIGRALNLSVAAVKTRLHRARLELSTRRADSKDSPAQCHHSFSRAVDRLPAPPAFNQSCLCRSSSSEQESRNGKSLEDASTPFVPSSWRWIRAKLPRS